jgi:hypothetical protein
MHCWPMVNTLFLTTNIYPEVVPLKNTVANLQTLMLQGIISICLLAHHHINLSHRIVAVMMDIMAYASVGAPMYAGWAYDDM